MYMRLFIWSSVEISWYYFKEN